MKMADPYFVRRSVESTPYYMEAEVNSPIVDLQAGESYAMDTSWWPTRADGQLRDVTDAG